jgi:hypothetical protein
MDSKDITDVKMLEDKIQKYIRKDKFDTNKIYYIIPIVSFILLTIIQPAIIKQKKVVKSIEIEEVSIRKFIYAWLILSLIFVGVFVYWKNKQK